jgi:hypothetical protein
LRVVDHDIGLAHGACHRLCWNGSKVASPWSCLQG